MDMDDNRILDLLWRRSEQGITALSEAYGRRLYATANNIVCDHQQAEECVNDTYLALWNAIPPKRPNPLVAYAVRTIRNIALNRLRSDHTLARRSDYDVSLDELAGCIGDDSLQRQLETRELGRMINTFISTLNRENRNLFLRRYWFGDGVKEIANAYGLTENIVSVRLTRIRVKLRAYLIQEGYYEK